jgi:hypothetical protein
MKNGCVALYWRVRFGSGRFIMKIVSARNSWVNIDNEDEWLTYDVESGRREVVSKKAWPTYGISLTLYKRYFPLEPPIEITCLEEIDQDLMKRIRKRIRRYTPSY